MDVFFYVGFVVCLDCVGEVGFYLAAIVFEVPFGYEVLREVLGVFLLFREDFEEVVFSPGRFSHFVVEVIGLADAQAVFVAFFVVEFGYCIKLFPFFGVLGLDGIDIGEIVVAAGEYDSGEFGGGDSDCKFAVAGYLATVFVAVAGCDSGEREAGCYQEVKICS